GAPFTASQAIWLAAGSTIGIAVQTLVLLPFLKRIGLRYRPRFDLRHSGLFEVFRDGLWMFLYVGVIQVVQMWTMNLCTPIDPATGQPTAGAGWAVYQNSSLIWLIPHSLITVSLATAILPANSRAATRQDAAELSAGTRRAARLALIFLIPSALAMIVLGNAIAQGLFGYYAGSDDYHFVSWTLMAMGVGLVPYSVQYIYLRVFYARKDYRTPFLIQLPISAVTAGLAWLLITLWTDPATVAPRLALAVAAAYWVGFAITQMVLRKRLPDFSARGLARYVVRLLLAAIPAVAVGWAVNALVNLASFGFAPTAGLAAAIVVAVAGFFAMTKVLHIPEVEELVAVLRRRPPPGPPAGSGAAAGSGREVFDQDQQDVSDADSQESAAVPVQEDTQGPDEYFADSGEFRNAAGQPPVMEPTEQLLADPDGKGVFIKVASVPDPLMYSIPPQYEEGTAEIKPVGPGGAEPEQMLAGRFRLDQLLSGNADAELWRAFDESLDRWVLVYLLHQPGKAAESFLRSARRAAQATDARFLRVLDVVEAKDPAFVVYEYAPGVTLANILTEGPLTGSEIAWIARDAADALARLHEAGLTHGRLNPATVMITATGNVKITGLLAAETDSPQALRDLVAEDVAALGRLLYAGLTAKWLGLSAYGLEGIDPVDGALATPSPEQTVADASVLNVIDRILYEPKGSASHISSAAKVATQLSLILGPASAAADLKRRLRITDDNALISTVAPPEPVLPYPPVVRNTPSVPPELATELEEEDPLADTFGDNIALFTPVPPPPEYRGSLGKLVQFGRNRYLRAGIVVAVTAGAFYVVTLFI
ncbi:MAG: protein kinase, partial [Propionibacteriaceae bacterium]|nr:protein kinase [Propionibacteriaceae bacterium]